MSLTIKLRNPEVSESYTYWKSKTGTFGRKYYECNAPDKHSVLWQGELSSYAMRQAPDGLVAILKKEAESGFNPKTVTPFLLAHIPKIPPEHDTLIDFLCSYLAACLKYPNAIIETNY